MKTSDIYKALNRDEQDELSSLFIKIWAFRNSDGKRDLLCVVVEHDWPEYPVVLDMLQKRINEEREV